MVANHVACVSSRGNVEIQIFSVDMQGALSRSGSGGWL
jgi:hypothetical protein